jgi:preprotein translocase subunit SecY
MLRAFVTAFRIPDLRRKLLFTLAIILVYRIGAWIPIPGVDVDALRDATAGSAAGRIVGIINVFAGGALQQMAVFALGIMPYITSSIMMQLLTVVIPRLEDLQREGEQGRRTITQYTRYVTVALALLQGTALVTLARNGTAFGGVNVMPAAGTGIIILAVLTLTAGTALIMWLGELITSRGIGNGMSLLIYVSIISQFPSEISIVRLSNGWGWVVGVLLLGVGLTVAVVFMEMGQRRIPVQYARRQVGRRTFGGQSTYIPLKVNQSGVIPVIFASSLIYLPGLAAQLSGNAAFAQWTNDYLADATSPWYILTFAVLTIFFAYFYSAITFNPVEIADNMQRYGGFIPGIRPGRQTAEQLDRVLTRITLPGALYLTIVAVIPFILLAVGNIQAFPLGGVSLLIMVGVALQTMQQVESQLLQRNYEGFIS